MVAFIAQPEPRVERDLLVAAAAGVNLVGQRADALFEFADDEGMNVFICCTIEKSGRRGVFPN